MFPSTIKIKILTFTLTILLCFAFGQDRTIISKLNPGCPNCWTNTTTIVYVKAEGSSDTIHELWDFTGGMPTMIFAIADVNSTLEIVWEDTKPVKFYFPKNTKYSFATVIDKLYEYNDLEDSGRMERKSPQREYSLRRLRWNLKESVLTDKQAMVRLHGSLHEDRQTGIVDIKLDLLPYKDYAAELPHLIHTANSTLVDISLVDLNTSRHFNSSRFALHFVLASTDDSSDTLHNIMRKSLDDEHTPGVFEIIEIKTPASYNSGDGGFLQFRPVGYTQRNRNVASSTIAHVSDFNRTMIPRHSTLSMFYWSSDPEKLLVQDMVVSFGEPGDGFYKQHNYTAWSYTIGYGTPPLESFSFFVVMVICIGLGIPVALALSGIAYVVVRRYRQRNQPRPFTNED